MDSTQQQQRSFSVPILPPLSQLSLLADAANSLKPRASISSMPLSTILAPVSGSSPSSDVPSPIFRDSPPGSPVSPPKPHSKDVPQPNWHIWNAPASSAHPSSQESSAPIAAQATHKRKREEEEETSAKTTRKRRNRGTVPLPVNSDLRTYHNKTEQRRRERLRNGFERLRMVLPRPEDRELSNCNVLIRAHEYIQQLKAYSASLAQEIERRKESDRRVLLLQEQQRFGIGW